VAVLSLLVMSCGGSQGSGGTGGTPGAGGAAGTGTGGTPGMGGARGSGGSSAAVCVPGASVSCACTTGATGAQVCNASGSGYGNCTCSGSGTGGTAGTGGGPSGAAGTIGAGGASAGGAGGRAGSSGAAGTTGSGGSAGAKGGAGGTAGTTGAGGQSIDAGTSTDGKVSSTGTGGSYAGRWVSVQIVDAIIAPGKTDGTAWDWDLTTVTIPASVWNALGTALAGGDPLGGTLAVLAGPELESAISTTNKPDAYGWAQATVFGVSGDAYWLADRSDAIPDNYTPIWPYGWHYTNVPIDSDVRILVNLSDKDLVNDDPIGAAEINSTDLMDALAVQQKFYVRVDDQTDGQLLFIGISVVQQTGLM
jgi:hypothetical protein